MNKSVIMEQLNKESYIYETPSYKNIMAYSRMRLNLVEWLKIAEGDKVLCIGRDIAPITEYLLGVGADVTRLESVGNSVQIVNKETNGLSIKVFDSSYKELAGKLGKDYDYILAIGILDDSRLSGYGKDEAMALMRDIKQKLKKTGKLIVVGDNRYGMKYMAGCREAYTGEYFASVEGFKNNPDIHTLSKKGFVKAVKDSGLRNIRFYYPYPDYRMPIDIFSDDYLPKKGSLDRNLLSLEGERIKTFNEGYFYDSLIEDRMFPEFSNSFLAVASNEDISDYCSYYRYSVERTIDKCIRTGIGKDKAGLYAEKCPYLEGDLSYVHGIFDKFNLLKNRYAKFDVNRCEKTESGVRFDFVEGKTLEELLDTCLEKDDMTTFYQLIDEYKNRVLDRNLLCDFSATDEFKKVFGKCDMTLKGIAPANIDLIFGNIIKNEDSYAVIDYEWTFDFAVPIKYIFYRAIFDYAYKNDKRKVLWDKELYAYMGISEEEKNVFEKMDMAFHQYVNGSYVSLGILNEKIDNQVYDAVLFATSKNPDTVQVYPDMGDGISEETSLFFRAKTDENGVSTVAIEGIKDAVKVRIDPAQTTAAIKIIDIKAVDVNKNVQKVDYYSNAATKINGFEIFDTDDPQIYIKKLPEKTTKIRLSFVKSEISKEFAAASRTGMSDIKFKINAKRFG